MTAVEWLMDIKKRREIDKFDWEQALTMERQQQEISDEEIYKESFKQESPIWHKGFLEGAFWYREQLKK